MNPREMDESKSLDPGVFEAEKAGAQGLLNIHFIDLTDRLCNNNVCWAFQGGEIIYRDNNHLTGSFANSLAPALATKLSPGLKWRREISPLDLCWGPRVST